MTGLGENHVASQIELPTIGNKNNASLQHARFSGGIKGEEREGRSANPKRRERSRTKSWMQRSAQEKDVNNGAKGGQSTLLRRTLGKTT